MKHRAWHHESKLIYHILSPYLGNKHPLTSYFRLPLRYHWDHGHLCKQHEDNLRFRHRPSTNHRRTREGFCGNVWVLWCECVYLICWYLLLFFVRSCCLCVVLVIGDCWCFFRIANTTPEVFKPSNCWKVSGAVESAVATHHGVI